MSQDQNAGQSQNINSDNSSSERVEVFKYLGTTLTDHDSIQAEIRADQSQGMLPIICFRIFSLPVCQPKI